MSLDCVCKGISSHHTEAAQASRPQTVADLYALALAHKKADPDAKITGLEDKNGSKFNCGRCRDVFADAVQGAVPIIMMRAIASETRPPRIGSCGNDCNTCAPKVVEAAGCQPHAL